METAPINFGLNDNSLECFLVRHTAVVCEIARLLELIPHVEESRLVNVLDSLTELIIQSDSLLMHPPAFPAFEDDREVAELQDIFKTGHDKRVLAKKAQLLHLLCIRTSRTINSLCIESLGKKVNGQIQIINILINCFKPMYLELQSQIPNRA